jgi:hypothetical protein
MMTVVMIMYTAAVPSPPMSPASRSLSNARKQHMLMRVSSARAIKEVANIAISAPNEGLSKEQVHYMNIIKEVVNTEKTYVSDLVLVFTV